MRDIFSFKKNLSLSDAFQMCEHSGDRTFAGAGFTYDPEAFSSHQFKAYVIYRCGGFFAGYKDFFQMVGF